MKKLYKGQEISKYKVGGKITFFGRNILPFVLVLLSVIVSIIIFNYIDKTYLNNLSKAIVNVIGLVLIVILSTIVSLSSIYFYFESKRKNPSVTYFEDHLSIISDHNEGEIDVPFKMIKKIRFIEDSLVTVEYKEEYVIKVLIENEDYWHYVVEEPITDRNSLKIPEPGSKNFPQDKKNEIFPLGKFSFRLKTNSKETNLKIIDELNSKVKV